MPPFHHLFLPNDDDEDRIRPLGPLGRGPIGRRPRDPFNQMPPEPRFDAFRDAWRQGAGLGTLFGGRAFTLDRPVGEPAPADEEEP